jgi:transposase
MAVALPDTRGLSDEVLAALRLRAVAAWELGYAIGTIADILGVARETVSRWCAAYRRDGLDGLPHERSGRPVGAGRWLTAAQERHLQELILGHHPDDYDIPAVLWTRKAVRDLIARQYGLRLPLRTVGLYLERWGWTPQRPTRKNYYEKPEEVRQWLEETYPTIEARAQAEDAEIQWGDEMGVDADQSFGRGYAPPGQTPERQVTGGHVRINLISTITAQGQVQFMLYAETMTAALFIVFLTRLVRESTRKIFLIVDRLQAHKTPAVQAWLACHADQIEIFELPCYAPELNPDEYLNHDVKETVSQEELAKNPKALQTKVEGFMQKLRHLPERVASYFQHPQVAYAAFP